MAPRFRLEGSWRISLLQEICAHRGPAYVQLGFPIYAGNGLCNAGASIMARQAHAIYSALGMVDTQVRRDPRG